MILGARLDSGSQVLSSISNQRALADSEALSNCATGVFNPSQIRPCRPEEVEKQNVLQPSQSLLFRFRLCFLFDLQQELSAFLKTSAWRQRLMSQAATRSNFRAARVDTVSAPTTGDKQCRTIMNGQKN